MAFLLQFRLTGTEHSHQSRGEVYDAGALGLGELLLAFLGDGPLHMKLTVRAVHISPLEPHTFTRPQPRGRLTTDATEPEWNGYLLTVAYACVSCLAGG